MKSRERTGLTNMRVPSGIVKSSMATLWWCHPDFLLLIFGNTYDS